MMNKVILGMFLLTLLPGKAMGSELKTEYQFDSPPRYFIEDGKAHGICVDIIDKLNEKLQKNNITIVSVAKNVPFERIKLDLERGNIDIFFGISKNKEREKKYIFSNVLYEMHYTFVKLKSNPLEYLGDESLKGKAIGALRGTNSAKSLAKNKEIKLYLINSIPQGFKMLMLNRLDAIYYHDLGLGWNIKKEQEYRDIELLKTDREIKYQYVAFSKNIHSKIITQIAQTFDLMAEDGTLAKIMKKYSSN